MQIRAYLNLFHMKKLFSLLMMPLISLAQTDSLNVSDLLGEWYGVTTNGSTCYDITKCGPVKSVDNKTYIAYKYRITQNNDKLVINNVSIEDSALFHGNVSKNIYISFASDNTLPITNGKVKPSNSAIQLINSNTISFQFIDLPSLTLTRSRGNYDKLLLSQNLIINDGCAVLPQTIACITSFVNEYDFFTIKKDTLIQHQLDQKTKYLYSDSKQAFINYNQPEISLKFNATTQKVQIKNTEDSLEIDLANTLIDGNNISTITGDWGSTTRQGKFIKINEISTPNHTNPFDFSTNSIDSLYNLKITTPNGFMVLNQYLVDTFTTSRTFLYQLQSPILSISKAYLFVEALETTGYSDIVTTLKPQWFSITSGSGDILKNLNTGEEFSKVTSVTDNSIESQISINPNPATSDFVKVSGIDNFNYEIFNSTGILLKQGQSNTGTIAVDDLPNGLMTVKINNGKNQYTTKLVK